MDETWCVLTLSLIFFLNYPDIIWEFAISFTHKKEQIKLETLPVQ